ncbi:hypothetical protein Adu01nite_87210 [Paractinoplanes durhamensis]|uniref:Uncharacterized protein n=1 Tax=Paractinoplanes durhamensis TaxID=113563 RepID=A0ABQ3ZC63_9ACTN|nr:hypothetical protein Adu01nite_87210 [Actinoplanes durhamensis]
MLEAGRRQLDKLGGQIDGRLVGEPTEHDMTHPPGLLDEGRIKHRMPVPMNGRPPRRHPVDKLAPIGQPQPHALGALDDVGITPARHRPVGMPDVRTIEGDELSLTSAHAITSRL